MKKIYSDGQIVGFVREAEKTEVTIAEFCRQIGRSFKAGFQCAGKPQKLNKEVKSAGTIDTASFRWGETRSRRIYCKKSA